MQREDRGQCVMPSKRGKGSTGDGGEKKENMPRRPRMMWVGNLHKLLESS